MGNNCSIPILNPSNSRGIKESRIKRLAMAITAAVCALEELIGEVDD